MFKMPLIIILALVALTNHADSNSTDFKNVKPMLGQEVHHYASSIISPDGADLPDGNGTVEQGKQIYLTKCAACHGSDGTQAGNQLVGGIGSLATSRPLKTVGSFWPYATTLYDYIARAMPYNNAKSLSANEVYAVSAYILMLNGILKSGDTLDKNSLPKVSMPNENGFIELTN